MTALLIFACRKERAWIPEVTEFEALLGAIRASPALLQHFPGDVPQGHEDTLRRVWSAYVGKVRAIVGGDIPIHRLVAGDPGSNPLADVLALPGGALDEVVDHDIATTSHCTQLTRSTADESRLLLVMLQGVVGFAAEQPLSFKAAETLLRTTLVEPADDRLAEAWLDANAPHQHHSGLMALWHDFWEERTSTLHDDSGADDYRRFLATWLPVSRPVPRRRRRRSHLRRQYRKPEGWTARSRFERAVNRPGRPGGCPHSRAGPRPIPGSRCVRSRAGRHGHTSRAPRRRSARPSAPSCPHGGSRG